jgi:crotonobetainyl-CoA:carnitine CoA-transferase CaiB-like acyl-CoA transferase
MLGDLFALESLEPGSVHPLGNASPLGAPWGCYPCAGDDEWCAVTVRSDDEWRKLCAAIGEPDWAADARFDTAVGRIAEREKLDELLGGWTAERESRAVMETLQAAGVPAGLLAHPEHHMSDPQMVHRGYQKLIIQPDYESILVEGPPFLGSDLPDVVTDPAPWLGEHTREIAKQLLGLSDAEIEELIEAGVLEDPPKEFKAL